jgi:hypothetical protein
MKGRFLKLIIFSTCILWDIRGFSQFKLGFTGGVINSRNSLTSSEYSVQNIDIIYQFTNFLPSGAPAAGLNPFYTTNYANLSSRFSGYGGLVFDLKLAPDLSIRAKLLVESKGWKETAKINGYDLQFQGGPGSADEISQDEVFKLTYLTLPLNLLFYAPIGKVRLFFGAGFYFGYGLTGHYKVHFNQASIYNYNANYVNTGYIPATNPQYYTFADSVAEISFYNDTLHRSAVYHANTFDIGLSAGIGLEFRNGLFIDLSYENGLSTVLLDRYGYKNYGTGKFEEIFPNRNRSLSLGLGLFLNKIIK